MALKNRTKIGTPVDNRILERFRDLANKTRITQSKLLDEALLDLLEKYKEKEK